MSLPPGSGCVESPIVGVGGGGTAISSRMKAHLAGLGRFFIALALCSVAPGAQGFRECVPTIHVLEGEAAGDLFGWISAPIPDVDGDGVQELLVSAVGHDTGGSGAGRVYLYDGRSGAELWHFDGTRAGENAGFAGRDARDTDLDGIADVIVGAAATATTRGSVRVLSGASGAVIHGLRLGVNGDQFGAAVAGLDDLDGDGWPEFAGSAPLDDGAGANAGRVYVISGFDGTTVVREFAGEAAGDRFGTALGRLGDLNGDGRAELAVGAADGGTLQRGRAYVFDPVTGAELFRFDPDASASEFGQFFTESAGEIDGDGVPDIYVGDYVDTNGRGKAYFFSGATGARLRTLVGSVGDGFGIGRPIGDVDGDGRTEMVLGSWTNSSGAVNAGQVGVFAGSDGRRLRTITSLTAGEALGYDAHGLGDVDGDGRLDLCLTAANFDNQRGRVYVIAAEPVTELGHALAGSGALAPELALGGCPRTGELVTFEVTRGLGGAFGTLVLGANRADLPFRGGILVPETSFARFPHVLAGATGQAGSGATTLAAQVPLDPALLGLTFFLQGVYRDAGAPGGFSLTNALSLAVY